MAEARLRANWDETAVLWQNTANAIRDPKQRARPYMPWDIHPFRTPDDYKQQQPQHGDLSGLRRIIEEAAKNGKIS